MIKKEDRTDQIKKRRKFPPQPEKDLLLFIEQYSRELDGLATGYFDDDARRNALFLAAA